MSMTEKKINSWITITSHFVLLVQTKQGFWMLKFKKGNNMANLLKKKVFLKKSKKIFKR